MNKSVKRVLAVFLTIIIMAGLFYGCGHKKEATDTYTDNDGYTYITVEDEANGEILVGFTDKDGNLFAAHTDADGNVLKDGVTYPVNNYDGTLPYNDTTAVSVDSGDSSHNWAGEEVVTVSKDQTTAPNTTTTKNNSNTEKTTNTATSAEIDTKALAEKYKTLFASGTFYIEFSTEDEDMPDPVTAAVKNGSIYMKTKFENMNCTLIYQKQNDKLYMVLTDFRVYCKMPSDMMEDLDLSNFSSVSGEVEKTESYEAMLGNRECQCESYYLKDGTITTFYFYNGELVRMDQIHNDGTSTVMNINKISSQVDDSLFTLPKLFIPLDLSNLDLDDIAEE